MAVRKIVKIDEEKCDGCGECVPSCAEGAIRIVDGKARLVADVLCDGLGACLGECPAGAITIEDRDAVDFDEHAVKQHLASLGGIEPAPGPRPSSPFPILEPGPGASTGGGGCPGSRVMSFGGPAPVQESNVAGRSSALRQWPVQLHLVPPTAPFFQGADLLLAADCTAFALPDFHERWLGGRSIAVACPKLDQGQEIYLAKLQAMIDQARLASLTVLIMEVPCCSGLVGIAQEARARATRKPPLRVVRVGLRGEVLSDETVA